MTIEHQIGRVGSTRSGFELLSFFSWYTRISYVAAAGGSTVTAAGGEAAAVTEAVAEAGGEFAHSIFRKSYTTYG